MISLVRFHTWFNGSTLLAYLNYTPRTPNKYRVVNPSMDTVSVADSPAAPPRATPLYGRAGDEYGQ